MCVPAYGVAFERCLCCRAMDCKVAELRATTDLTRIWIHADLDAFFASVEELDDPSLVRQPLQRALWRTLLQCNGREGNTSVLDGETMPLEMPYPSACHPPLCLRDSCCCKRASALHC